MNRLQKISNLGKLTEKKIKICHYSKFYSKLRNKIHTTIRKHNNWKIGQILIEKVNGKFIQEVEVIAKKRGVLLDFTLKTLRMDTDEKSFIRICNLFNEMKRKIFNRYNNSNRTFKPYDFGSDIFTLYTLEVKKQTKIEDFLTIKESVLA